MLLRLKIKNYKSIRAAHIDLRPGITILVGPNGSGKTCVLSALQFLRDVFRVGAAQALARQGGSRRVYHHGQSQMEFCFEQPYGERTYRRHKIPCNFCWQVTIAQAGPDQIATIVREKAEIVGNYGQSNMTLFSLEVDRTGEKPKVKTYLCSHIDFGHDLFSIWKIDHKSKKKSLIAEHFTDKIFKYASNRLRKDSDRSSFPLIAQLDKTLNDIYSRFMFLNEYNILPDLARASTEQLPFVQMSPNGKGVSEVIDALENERYHKLEQLRFMDYGYMHGVSPYYVRHSEFNFMRPPFRRWHQRREPYAGALDNINRQLSAAVRPITAVSVEIDPTNGRRFVVFKAGSEKFYPEEVSDGTVKWLCILVSLFVPFSLVSRQLSIVG